MILLRCYPKITDWIFYVSGEAIDVRFLPIYSYGFFVALGFIVAATLATFEMRRREKLGLMPGTEKEIVIGEAPNPLEIALYFILGFIILFKAAGLFHYSTLLSNGSLELRDYILSFTYGNIPGGFIGGLLFAGIYYYQKNKEKKPTPIRQKVMVYPSDQVGDLVVIAAIFGVLGSNFFNFLENPDDYQNFWADPVGSMFSGLSIYGGLICAGAAFAVYARMKKIPLFHFFDSVAPGFILANGIGRIGCHVSGDGDWGVANLAPKPDWMPQFMWSNFYEHNIINEGVPMLNCVEAHCYRLAEPVYPTPIYEFLMCSAIFVLLWSIRKKVTYMPGFVFTFFMILIGIQRFAIEQWRDLSGRNTYGVLGMNFKQSELISILMVVLGIAGTLYVYRKYNPQKNKA